MLEKVSNDESFGLLMKRHIYECLDYLLQNGIDFYIFSDISLIGFAPELPEEIKKTFKAPIVMFVLSGYTFQSAILSKEEISFEAGFGKDNFASVVKVPLNAIVQIGIENQGILTNISNPKKPVSKTDNTQKSLSIFKSNPNNKHIIKK
ncbi:hypothetical protein [Campylobacter pinnipediorum]|uniref:Uncharacterized protein n=1 Tax=Campylobacter pinnipediorum subsp. pinnipediorum TaxID=1660067 RepID=A0AAX0LBY5_9BACT|nr:hypothetical protein [Campylobacter pinnipediorum]AQW83061.1 hypothetical protein CPIN17261_1058 [Campylobacter pinnipediorum subsp. pinnipediorum]OPA81897.1 hypothetical protein BFG04_01780 [Campylobacter pinnipediorum subsp. pinnipediorum]